MSLLQIRNDATSLVWAYVKARMDSFPIDRKLE
jgi:hypothetical protein